MSLENDMGSRILSECLADDSRPTTKQRIDGQLIATISIVGGLLIKSIDRLTKAVEQSADINVIDEYGEVINKSKEPD